MLLLEDLGSVLELLLVVGLLMRFSERALSGYRIWRSIVALVSLDYFFLLFLFSSLIGIGIAIYAHNFSRRASISWAGALNRISLPFILRLTGRLVCSTETLLLSVCLLTNRPASIYRVVPRYKPYTFRNASVVIVLPLWPPKLNVGRFTLELSHTSANSLDQFPCHPLLPQMKLRLTDTQVLRQLERKRTSAHPQ